MIFKDIDGDDLEVGDVDERCMFVSCKTNTLLSFEPSTARAVAAEIIACADRIEGKDSAAPMDSRAALTTGDLATLAKAIAYLPSDLRNSLNAALAKRINEVLS